MHTRLVSLHTYVHALTCCLQVVKFHTATQKVESHFVGAHRFTGEPIFVPDRTATDAAEDSGWLLSIVHDGKAEQTELHVLNAQVRARVGDGGLARMMLRQYPRGTGSCRCNSFVI